MDRLNFNPENQIIGKIYFTSHRIASGAYGHVYSGVNMKTKNKVALKFEATALLKKPYLKWEYDCYGILKKERGFPKVHYFGSMKSVSVLVLDRLGPSLNDFFRICDRKLSLKTVAMLAEQLIRRLQTLHGHGLLHCDIKPNNFVMGRKSSYCTVYMIDLGMAQGFWDETTNMHVPLARNDRMCGTLNFISLNAHRRLTQSRRDDMEALGYMFVLLLKGSLPWQSVREENVRIKNKLIYELKNSIPLNELCQDLPEEFELYLQYCRMLKYEEKPNYKYLKMLFRNLLELHEYYRDHDFDWVKIVSMNNVNPNQNRSVHQSIPKQSITEKYLSFSKIR